MSIKTLEVTVLADQAGEGYFGETLFHLDPNSPAELMRLDIDSSGAPGEGSIRLEETGAAEQVILDDVLYAEGQNDGPQYMDAVCKDNTLEDNGAYQTYFLVEGELRLRILSNAPGDTITLRLFFKH